MISKPKVLLVVPVYNEEKILEDSIEKLVGFFKDFSDYDLKIVIANNGSDDDTLKIARMLSRNHEGVEVFDIKEKGRGNALKKVWMDKLFEGYDVYSYCDCDLATDVNDLPKMFDKILKGNNIVIGSRYIKGADSQRTIKRYVLSKIYIFLVKLFFKTKINDFQCGFKAVDKNVVCGLLSKIQNNEWFFDSELLLVAEKEKYKIFEIPVKWREKRVKDSKVKLINTGVSYINELIKLKKGVSLNKNEKRVVE